MNSWLILILYVIIGISGLVFHWWKKFYLDLTTTDTLKTYLLHDLRSTLNAFCSIIAGEVTLAVASSSDFYSLGAISGAFAVGYTLDSIFNRSSDHKS